MAVNGVEIKVGQTWRTRDRGSITVTGERPGRGRWPWQIRRGRNLHSVTDDGFQVAASEPKHLDLIELITPAPNETQQERFAATDETAGHIDRASNQPFPDTKATDAAFGNVDLREIHPSTNAAQVGGDHYKTQPIQPWDYILANGLGFLAGNVVKYVSRFDKKNGVEDLKKARHYLDKLIESEQAK